MRNLPAQGDRESRKLNFPSNFPSIAPFKRLGNKATILSKLKRYCEERSGYDDILALCEGLKLEPVKPAAKSRMEASGDDGFVYLMKSGRHYKIGRSVSAGQREHQLKIQPPEKAATVHSIRTDDPVGIEAYWHKRFEAKRKNGEWFELSSADVNIFKRRKFM